MGTAEGRLVDMERSPTYVGISGAVVDSEAGSPARRDERHIMMQARRTRLIERVLGYGVLAGTASWSGCVMTRPARTADLAPPSALAVRPVSFPSRSGSTIRAWLLGGSPGVGAVLLLHGVGDNRSSMVGRARFLHRAGYTVLLPDFQEALEDRLGVWLGPLGMLTRVVAPLVIRGVSAEIGIGEDALRPIDHIGRVGAPVFVIAGTRDAYTPLGESRALFEQAREPKEFWAVEGARHEDLHAFAGDIYEQRVGEFLAHHLRTTPSLLPSIVAVQSDGVLPVAAPTSVTVAPDCHSTEEGLLKYDTQVKLHHLLRE